MRDNHAKVYDMTTKERHNLSTVHSAIERRVDFDCNGTLVGQTSSFYGLGRLPEQFRADALLAMEAYDAYFVYSYATPIAWFADGEWTIPDVKYSTTTSRHQNIVRGAVA